jgi:hypothetical protein
MAGEPNVGSIAVAVVPSAKDFTERMRARLLPQADALGREVGERIRAGVEEKLGDVRLGVNADTAKANAELDKTRLKADELGAKDESIRVSVHNSGGVMGWLVSAVAAATAIAPAFAVAGVGVGAFAALAIPSLKSVVQYEQDLHTNAAKARADWQGMTTDQRALAIGVGNLGSEFSSMAREVDPQVMQVFEAVVANLDRILPEVVPLAKAAGSAIVGTLDSIGTALTDSQAQQFFDFVAKNIGPDMHEIDVTVVALIHTLFNLIEALQPTSLELLHLVAGFAGMVSEVSKVAPGVISVTLLAIALYRPLRLIAGLELGEKFQALAAGLMRLRSLSETAIAASAVEKGLEGAATGAHTFAVAADGTVTAVAELTRAEKASAAAGALLEAVSPTNWAIAGTAAIAGLTYVLLQHAGTMDGYIARLREQDQATGYNIAGFQRLAAQTDQAGKSALALTKAEQSTVPAFVSVRTGAASYSHAVGQVYQAHVQAVSSAENLRTHLQQIQDTFGLTTTQAERLAVAAGVSAKDLAGNGPAAQEAMQKILDYGRGTDEATGTTNALSLAVQSLTTAMEQNVVQVLTLEGDQVAWKQAQQAATDALQKNHGALDGNSKAALEDRQAIIGATSAVVQFAEEQFKAHGNLQGASDAIQDQIRWLETHAGKSKIAREEIHALRMEEAKIKKQIREQIIINASGDWSLTGAPGHEVQHHRPVISAEGAYITGGTPGKDSVLALTMPGELIVPTDLVQAGAVDHLRGMIPGFAGGGVVPSYSGGVPGATDWVDRNYNATVDAFSSDVAQAAFSQMTQAFAAMAGPSGPLSASAGKAQAFARSELGAFGWGAAQWAPLLALWNRESGWNSYAVNPASGAYGIPQSLGHGHPYALGDYMAQVMWGLRYIDGRYGSPAAAWAHEVAAGWYDQGGWLMPGASLTFNGTGRPEPVLSDSQWRMLSEAVQGGDGGTEYHAHFDGMTAQAYQGQVRTAFRAMEMQKGRKSRVGRRR